MTDPNNIQPPESQKPSGEEIRDGYFAFVHNLADKHGVAAGTPERNAFEVYVHRTVTTMLTAV